MYGWKDELFNRLDRIERELKEQKSKEVDYLDGYLSSVNADILTLQMRADNYDDMLKLMRKSINEDDYVVPNSRDRVVKTVEYETEDSWDGSISVYVDKPITTFTLFHFPFADRGRLRRRVTLEKVSRPSILETVHALPDGTVESAIINNNPKHIMVTLPLPDGEKVKFIVLKEHDFEAIRI